LWVLSRWRFHALFWRNAVGGRWALAESWSAAWTHFFGGLEFTFGIDALARRSRFRLVACLAFARLCLGKIILNLNRGDFDPKSFDVDKFPAMSWLILSRMCGNSSSAARRHAAVTSSALFTTRWPPEISPFTNLRDGIDHPKINHPAFSLFAGTNVAGHYFLP